MTTYTATATVTPAAPSFVVYVTPDSDDSSLCDIEVETADDSGFTTGVDLWTLSAQTDEVTVGVAVGPFVAGETKYVRARAGVTPTWSSWTSTITQVIPDGTSDGGAYVYENVGVTLVLDRDDVQYVLENVGVYLVAEGDWSEYAFLGDVDTDQPHPELWTVFPTSGRPGDGVTIWGIGFGEDAAEFAGIVEMYIDTTWVTVSVVSWTLVAANGDAYGPDRAIEPSIPNIDPEHNEIEITIPNDAIPPGHSVRVRTTI